MRPALRKTGKDACPTIWNQQSAPRVGHASWPVAALFRNLLLIMLCALPILADDTQLRGPVSGFVFDSQSQSIRPIFGVPGSSYLGPAAVGGFDAASISPSGVSALATQAGKLYFIRNLDGDQPQSTALEGAISGASQFAWSRDGSSAAVYSADSDQAQVLRNLDPRDISKTPAMDDAIDLASIEGNVSALAYDGKRLLIGIASPDTGGVYLASGSAAPALLARATNPVALAIDIAKGDLYIADQDMNQIWMVRDYAGAGTPMLVVDDRAGVSSPVGVRVGSNGRLLIANSGSRGVDALDVATRATVAHIDLDFTPGRMEALGSGPFSLLNFGGSDGPLYVVDGSGDLAVYFVPAGGAQ